MNGLLGMLDWCSTAALNGEQRDQLETAQRCAYSLLALLNDILDLSKIEAGKMVLEKIPFDRAAVLRGLREDRQAAKAAQKKIDLRFEADPQRADRDHGRSAAGPPDRRQSAFERHEVHRSAARCVRRALASAAVAAGRIGGRRNSR